MTQAAATGEFVEVEGLKTFYVHRGEGPPIIAIHGGSPGACALINWGANIEPLAALGFSVYAYDQPGYGYTDVPTDHSLEFRVRHAQAFIDALGLDRYHVMGNSQGSYIAARIALDDPKVDRLVLVSSGTLAPEGSEAAKQLSREHAEAIGSYEPGLDNMRKLSLGTIYHPELVTDEFVQLRYEMSIGSRFEASQARRGAGPGHAHPRPAPQPRAQDADPVGHARRRRGAGAGPAVVGAHARRRAPCLLEQRPLGAARRGRPLPRARGWLPAPVEGWPAAPPSSRAPTREPTPPPPPWIPACAGMTEEGASRERQRVIQTIPSSPEAPASAPAGRCRGSAASR